MTTINNVTCGCCSGGCVCSIHMDITRGLKNKPCSHHSFKHDDNVYLDTVGGARYRVYDVAGTKVKIASWGLNGSAAGWVAANRCTLVPDDDLD